MVLWALQGRDNHIYGLNGIQINHQRTRWDISHPNDTSVVTDISPPERNRDGGRELPWVFRDLYLGHRRYWKSLRD